MPAIKYKKKTYAGATFPVMELTKAEYDALSDAKKMDGTVYMIIDDDGDWEAENVSYDNTASGLTATNVQGALDEIRSVISDIISDMVDKSVNEYNCNRQIGTYTVTVPPGLYIVCLDCQCREQGGAWNINLLFSNGDNQELVDSADIGWKHSYLMSITRTTSIRINVVTLPTDPVAIRLKYLRLRA